MTTTTARLGEHAFTVGGARLRFRVAGRGPLLVMHPPGWGIGADPYIATLGRLEESFTVVYLWPRGSAGAGGATGSAALTVATFVSDLEALRLHLGVDQFNLAGHSHGGLVAMHYALHHPERVGRLLLIDTELIGVPAEPDNASPSGIFTDPPEVVEAMRYLAERGGFDSLFALKSDAEATEFLGRILPLYFVDPAAMAPLIAGMQSLALPCRTLQAVTASDGDFALNVSALSRLQIPTVIVAGRHDRVCSVAGAQGLAKLMPQSTLLIYEASGHFPWLEEPEDFFTQVPAAAGVA